MGIKHFFNRWFKIKFPDCVHTIDKKNGVSNIDNLFIDLNDIFHQSTQRTLSKFKLKKGKNSNFASLRQTNIFQNICNTINYLVKLLNPNKRLILCMDGVTPLSRQKQQRQKKFRN